MREAHPHSAGHDDTLVAPDSSRRTGDGVPSMLPTSSVLAGRYELTSMLGAGGMGTVFRAHDRELDETVALKVLDPELVDSIEALARFKAEVKLARRVTHRNVARTFDFGTHEELRFLTMEFVDGVSLADRILTPPPLEMEAIVALTREILQGLAAAHGAGVLHRDLKPANVMLARDGRVLLMDFGIAHAFETEEADRRTKAGLVGTPLYMSPEQVEGRRDLDARSDLYALGLMVHEMATGRVPFEGGALYAVAAARLLRPAPPFEASGAPAWFAAMVDRLLATDRGLRFASAEATLALFAEAEGARSTPAPVVSSFVETARGLRVAVLAFASDGAAPELGRALTEELSELLASTPRAQVIVGSLHGAETARDAGRRLDVDLVIEGRLTALGSEVALRLRLLTVADGFLLFATRTQSAIAGLPRWLDEAARALAAAFETKLAPSARPPTDPVTLDLYFRGRTEFHKRWGESARVARDLLSAAYTRAPDDAQIVAAYALLLARMFGFQGEQDEELATRMVERANALAPGRADSMMATCALAFQTGDTDRYLPLLHEVLSRNPEHADALDLLGRLLSELGPADEAHRVLHLARQADPLLVTTPIEHARVTALCGDWAGAEALLGELDRHDVPRAMVAFTRHRILKLWRADLRHDAALAQAIHAPGAFSDAERALLVQFTSVTQQAPAEVVGQLKSRLRAALQASPRQRRRATFNTQIRAEVMAVHQQWDDVLEALDEADQLGLFDVLWIDHVPLFAPLRGQPRFEAVRARIRARAQALRARLPLAGARGR